MSPQQSEQSAAGWIRLPLAQHLPTNRQQLLALFGLGVRELASCSVAALTHAPKRLALSCPVVTAFIVLGIFKLIVTVCESALFAVPTKPSFGKVFAQLGFVFNFGHILVVSTAFFNRLLVISRLNTELPCWHFRSEIEIFGTLN